MGQKEQLNVFFFLFFFSCTAPESDHMSVFVAEWIVVAVTAIYDLVSVL